jgi:hypothetical protein
MHRFIMIPILMFIPAFTAVPAEAQYTQCAFCDLFLEACNQNGDEGYLRDYCRVENVGEENFYCHAFGGLDECGEEETFAAAPEMLTASGRVRASVAAITNSSWRATFADGEGYIRNCRNMVVAGSYSPVRRSEIRDITRTIAL